ncbi:MAG TPA: hypothetical protein PLZ55_01065 [bacterium]|nr:hypothetical protein [bacterium]HPO07228.1 hypothetical protein [bacterium]HQO35524.1 hypothetical protein [bacterium]HQP99986.1 hypothetical protein [bacterium]
MEHTSNSHPSYVWENILAQNPGELATRVRQAATECHAAIAKLTLREEIDPRQISQMQTETNDLLVGVNELKNRLVFADEQVRNLSQDSAVSRYLEITQLLENGSPVVEESRRKALEAERSKIIGEHGPLLKKLSDQLRASLALRLEMIRHWKMLLNKAIDIYTRFKIIVRDNLKKICSLIEDPLLQDLVSETVSNEEILPEDLISAVRHRIPEDLGEIDRQALKELQDLSEIESRLCVVRESAAELENSESLVRQDVQRSSKPGEDTDHTSASPRTLMKGLRAVVQSQEVDKNAPDAPDSNRPRMFVRKKE